MKIRQYLFLFLLSLLVLIFPCVFQRVPGYMDADYYYATGAQIAEGKGFTQNFLWNYLDDPKGLPHPSHTYWMPLPSILVAVGMTIFHSVDFPSGRLVFVIFASVLPPLVSFAYLKLFKQSQGALLAGLFAVFPGFYIIYSTIAETFMPTMFLGAIYFLISFSVDYSRNRNTQIARFFLLGLLSGLFHLNRADGLLWIVATIILWGWQVAHELVSDKDREKANNFSYFLMLAGIIGGYGLVMFPWYFRNLTVFHSWFPPGNSNALWLANYDQTFIYPSSLLTTDRWMETGLKSILNVRFESTLTNLKTAFAVQGEIFLFPFLLWGMWELRKKPVIIFVTIFWFFLFLFMSIIFPFAGARGGFLHSSAAFQPIFWMLESVGFQKFIAIGVKRRGWNALEASKVFSAGLTLIAFGLTVGIFHTRVIGNDLNNPEWEDYWNRYQAVEQYLSEQFSDQGVVMVNNPPGYEAANNRGAIVIPFTDIETIRQVASKFNASYLVIDENYVVSLKELYLHPHDIQGLDFEGIVDDMVIYRIIKR